MNPEVESALIAAAATLVGVGGTVIVAITSGRNARQTNQATLDAAHADARRTLGAALEAQFADRYSKAVEQVGSANPDVRVGGIYALEGIALDSPRYHPTVMEVLAAIIRQQSQVPADSAKPAQWPLSEVQTALTVIGRREADHDIRAIDLANANLSGANLSGANLANANLTGTDLTGTNLTSANLTSAILFEAHLTGAYLHRTNLAGANLTSADLTSALFDGADLRGANLMGANFTSATLLGVHLTRAKFLATNFTQAHFNQADLSGTDLTKADLTGADLADAILTGTVWPGNTAIPDGWKLDGSGCLIHANETPDAAVN